jgi:hypothetical protein
MGMSNFDPTDPRVQLEIIRERLHYSEEKVREHELLLAQTNRDLGQKNAELKITEEERNDFKLKWEILQRDFIHSQETLTKTIQISKQKKKTVRFQAFLASLIFLLSSVLVNLGTTMLTSSPPNELGWVMIALAAASYIVAALMTTILALEGGNS